MTSVGSSVAAGVNSATETGRVGTTSATSLLTTAAGLTSLNLGVSEAAGKAGSGSLRSNNPPAAITGTAAVAGCSTFAGASTAAATSASGTLVAPRPAPIS